MRHAQHGLGRPGLGTLLQDGVEEHDRRLGAFEPEALLAHVPGVQEPLERLGGVETVQDVALLDGGEGGGHAFDVLLDPLLLLGILDVHVLDTQRAAVGIAQDVERVAQRDRVPPGQPVDHELTVQVPQGQAVGGGIELGVQRPRLGGERVEIGDQMTAHAVHVDQALDVDLLHEAESLVVPGVDVGLPAHGLNGTSMAAKTDS